MTICNISLRNIRKSLRDYAIYFFTLMLGVCLFYVFNSIETQTSMLALSKDSREVVKLLTQMISAISTFVAFVLGFLIIYSSRFMLKRRSKEFALYLILGMSKRRVSGILFVETLVIGFLSLVSGLLFGIFLSQITSVFVGKLFEANMTKYSFVFSSQAFDKTCIYFALIFLVVIFFNTIEISRSRLINLMQAKRKGERIRNIHPAVSVIGFILSLIILGRAYYMVCFNQDEITQEVLTTAIVLGVIGTLLFFWTLAGILVKFASSMKKIYYRGLNSFTFRQLASQANTNVIAMSVICLMFFFTICVLICSVNIKTAINGNIEKYSPADFLVTTRAESYDASKMLKLKEDMAATLEDSCSFRVYHGGFLMSMNDKEIVVDPKFKEIKKEGWFSYPIQNAVDESTYNTLAKFYGNKTVHLADDEYTVVSNYSFTGRYYDQILGAGKKLNLNGKKVLKPATKKHVEGALYISSNADNIGVVVVPDGYYSDRDLEKEAIVAKYPSHSKKSQEIMDHKLVDLAKKDLGVNAASCQTRSEMADASVGIAAFAVFIALYIGCIFLISGAAILAIKELSESADNRERYLMLRKLGADDAMINRALFRQIGIFFLMPLALAVVHSIPGMLFAKCILEIFSGGSLLPAILITAAIFGGVYGSYFLITYITSKRMIRE